MNRVTFECSGRFREDTGPTVTFFREGCVERVSILQPDGEKIIATLDEFVLALRQERMQRQKRKL